MYRKGGAVDPESGPSPIKITYSHLSFGYFHVTALRRANTTLLSCLEEKNSKRIITYKPVVHPTKRCSNSENSRKWVKCDRERIVAGPYHMSTFITRKEKIKEVKVANNKKQRSATSRRGAVMNRSRPFTTTSNDKEQLKLLQEINEGKSSMINGMKASCTWMVPFDPLFRVTRTLAGEEKR